jgi:putative lipoic acid-binding regulatory protein
MSNGIEYPSAVTFKIIYRAGGVRDSIVSCLSEKGLSHEITERPSEKGSFISYTVTAVFETEDLLQNVCTELKSINGFMTMF